MTSIAWLKVWKKKQLWIFWRQSMLRGGPCHMRLTVTCFGRCFRLMGYPDEILPCEVKREKTERVDQDFHNLSLVSCFKLILVRLMVSGTVSHSVPFLGKSTLVKSSVAFWCFFSTSSRLFLPIIWDLRCRKKNCSQTRNLLEHRAGASISTNPSARSLNFFFEKCVRRRVLGVSSCRTYCGDLCFSILLHCGCWHLAFPCRVWFWRCESSTGWIGE